MSAPAVLHRDFCQINLGVVLGVIKRKIPNLAIE
jgi:hypothetical protein